mgnify:FL=1
MQYYTKLGIPVKRVVPKQKYWYPNLPGIEKCQKHQCLKPKHPDTIGKCSIDIIGVRVEGVKD